MWVIQGDSADSTRSVVGAQETDSAQSTVGQPASSAERHREVFDPSAIRKISGPIRDHVNKPWKHYMLRQNKAFFSQLCSAMDMVADADDAIRAFEAGQFDHSQGGLYLATCGVLQALIVQQDAVQHLGEALGYRVNLLEDPALAEIRDIRHHSFGHPTRKDRPKSQGVSHNHIIQVSLSAEGFEMLSFMDDGSTHHRDVAIPQLIASQTKSLEGILHQILESLDEEERQHKDCFREEKLAPLFHASIDYHCNKIVEAACQDDGPGFGLINLQTVLQATESFRKAVGRRNMDFYESLQHDYDMIHYVAEKLTMFFEAKGKGEHPGFEQLSAEIFARFLASEVRILVEYAKDIDQDYES